MGPIAFLIGSLCGGGCRKAKDQLLATISSRAGLVITWLLFGLFLLGFYLAPARLYLLQSTSVWSPRQVFWLENVADRLLLGSWQLGVRFFPCGTCPLLVMLAAPMFVVSAVGVHGSVVFKPGISHAVFL